MTALYVILAVLLVLVLLSLVRVWVWAEYSQSGFLVRLRLGVISVQVFPMKKKAGTKKKQKPAADPREKQKRGGSFELIKESLPLVAEAARELKRKISIDELQIDLLWSLPDPASCAMGFGGVNAAVGMIWPLIEQNFHVRKHRIRTAGDFDEGKPTVYLLAQMTMRIGQLLSFALRIAFKFFKIYQDVNKRQKINQTTQQKEAV